MIYLPPFVIVDFETAEGGRGSTEYYRPGFRVISCVFTWIAADGSMKSDYVVGENAVGYTLERIARQKIPLVIHNAEFEMGVIRCRYPDIGDVVWLADTMRLVQVYDNGGDKYALEAPLTLDEQLDVLLEENDEDAPKKKKAKTSAGLGLVKAVRRVLQLPDHKHEAHQWLRTNVEGCREGKEGSYLNQLPADYLERYTVGDGERTCQLFQFIIAHFERIKYDWRLDHQLYFSSVKQIVESRIRGVPVDRVRLDNYRREIEQELVDLGCQFRGRFENEVKLVERSRLLLQIKKRKTLRGKRNYLKRIRSSPPHFRKDILFNVGSNKQLESLFCGVLAIQPKFRTDKGSPAFRSAVLSQWGDGGEILKRRRKRLLVLKQSCSLLELSAFDGRWHATLKACGTATGRFAGGAV